MAQNEKDGEATRMHFKPAHRCAAQSRCHPRAPRPCDTEERIGLATLLKYNSLPTGKWFTIRRVIVYIFVPPCVCVCVCATCSLPLSVLTVHPSRLYRSN